MIKSVFCEASIPVFHGSILSHHFWWWTLPQNPPICPQQMLQLPRPLLGQPHIHIGFVQQLGSNHQNTNHQHIERFTVWCEAHNWDFTDCWIIKIIVCSHQPIVFVHQWRHMGPSVASSTSMVSPATSYTHGMFYASFCMFPGGYQLWASMIHAHSQLVNLESSSRDGRKNRICGWWKKLKWVWLILHKNDD